MLCTPSWGCAVLATLLLVSTSQGRQARVFLDGLLSLYITSMAVLSGLWRYLAHSWSLRLYRVLKALVVLKVAMFDDSVMKVIPELGNSTLGAHLPELLGSGISTWGNSRRIESKLMQAAAGQHLNVYYVGGSITGCHRVDGANCWLQRVKNWFNAVYPGQSTHHTAGNGGTDSVFAASCIDQIVGEEADIVFIEYTINDMLHNTDIRGAELKDDFYKVETGLRRGLERLFRKLLVYQRSPAVILVHSWAPAISVHSWVEAPVHNFFHTTPEDLMDTVGKFYGVPSISMRNALHQLVVLNTPGFTLDDLWMYDGPAQFHPNDLGHIFLAFCVIDYLALILRQAEHSPWSTMEVVGAVAEQRIPKDPLFTGNSGHRGRCSLGEGLSRQASFMSPGWKWLKGEKAGYITDAPGEVITLVIPEPDDAGEALPGESSNRTGHIGVERSWKDYGMASVECQGNCTCDPFLIDLHSKGSNTTVQDVLDFPLARSAVESNESCAVTIEVLQDTSSRGHYVKLMSLGAE